MLIPPPAKSAHMEAPLELVTHFFFLYLYVFLGLSVQFVYLFYSCLHVYVQIDNWTTEVNRNQINGKNPSNIHYLISLV